MNDVRHKVLNVSLPEPVYWHVRQCASASRMSMKQFMAAFCQTAQPIDTRQQPQSPSDVKPFDPGDHSDE